MKCDKCGYSDNGSGDWAHICGPIEIKKPDTTNLIRQFEKESGLEIYGLGARRDKWEATIDKFVKLVAMECVSVVENLSPGYDDYRNQIEDSFRRDCMYQIKLKFGVEE